MICPSNALNQKRSLGTIELKSNKCRPGSVGLGSKAGKGSFYDNVEDAKNLYMTHKQQGLIKSKPLNLHGYTKEDALAALDNELPYWIDKAMHGYLFLIRKGSQVLSKVVETVD